MSNLNVIKNRRSFFRAILYLALSLILIGAVIIKGFSFKVVVLGILTIIMSLISFINSFSKEGIEEEIIKEADERDLYNGMRSTQITLKITNEICYIGTITFLAVYGITKIEFFLTVAITLCSVIILMFVALFTTNGYFEKNN